MLDILLFRRMIAPFILQILFWGAVGTVLFVSITLIKNGSWGGWMALIFGPLGIRVVFEIALLNFRVYDRLGAIERALNQSSTRG